MNRESSKAITGVILAGGRAERMGGRDKGLLSLAGRPLAAHAVDALRAQVEVLVINANRNLDAYRSLGCPVVNDDVGEFFGPLAGMLAALEFAETPYLLTVPCDSPLITEDYARRMRTALEREGAELSVASDGKRLQPVFALLHVGLEDSLRAYLAAGNRKIDRWFGQHRMAVTDFSDRPEMFRNVNTPEDLARLASEYQP